MNTAWWDCSQIYGSSEAVTSTLRNMHDDGKLLLTKDGREQFLPRDADGNPLTGFNNNWWIGMEMLHTLFAKEHNAICDMVRRAHPDWSGDQVFDKARLINCALMAKIHTVEWTPAILAHPALKIGMNANWWGLAGESLTKMLGRISKTSEVISGIPGSGVNNFGAPYSLTEEFVSVYRMHSLIPDTIAFFKAANGEHQTTIPVEDTLFKDAQRPLDDGLSFADTFYSFGINYPGAITNSNYPSFLRNLTTPDGLHRDMGESIPPCLLNALVPLRRATKACVRSIKSLCTLRTYPSPANAPLTPKPITRHRRPPPRPRTRHPTLHCFPPPPAPTRPEDVPRTDGQQRAPRRCPRLRLRRRHRARRLPDRLPQRAPARRFRLQ